MPHRADVALVTRGQAKSRRQAQAMIEAGFVRCGDRLIAKPAEMVEEDAELTVTGHLFPYVSRGGVKLAAALDAFGIEVAGKVCLDLGASTGGFTDVLLRRGAGKVYAVDVGRGQLAEKLRGDPKVVALEGTDSRALTTALIPESPALVTADLAFISLTKALGPALDLAAAGADLVALIKPQFELEKRHIGKGGIVRDPALHQTAVERVTTWLRERGGWTLRGVTDSPITGADGNREFLLGALNGKV